ncbi:MAG: DnaJ domain protein [Moraxellaceae bacterium]|jgi:hypothetical protein|nr:DnaJ domain protein [Moraxellaceae bacterium]
MEGANCWAVLGLEPGAEERAIKRAYARLLKANRPEDDAAAFQRLRHAYEMALALAASATANAAQSVSATDVDNTAPPMPEASQAEREPAAATEDADAESSPIRRLLEQLWHLNVAGDGDGVAAVIAEARGSLSLDDMSEFIASLRHICAFDTRVGRAFFLAVDTAMGWEHAPPARHGEEARIDHALQSRRDYWQAHGLLAGKLQAMKAALAAQNWDEVAHLNMRLQNALKDLGLDWRESVEQEVIGMLAACLSAPLPLIQRIMESWGGGKDYTQARTPAWLQLEQRLQGENFWMQLEQVRSGKLAVNWHYRRAVENLFMPWAKGLVRYWRTLYGAQQEMSRELVNLLQTHYPALLPRLDERVVQWWQTPRPNLGVYPERWVASALFIGLSLGGTAAAFLKPGIGAALLGVLVPCLVMLPVLKARLWIGWRWRVAWRQRLNRWERELTRRLLPGRWKRAADQHYRVLEHAARAAVFSVVPALILGFMMTDEGPPWIAVLLAFVPMWLTWQGWFVWRALRGMLSNVRDSELLYQIDKADAEHFAAPGISQILILLQSLGWVVMVLGRLD